MRPNVTRCALAALFTACILVPAPGHAFLDDLLGSGVDPALVARIPPGKRGDIKKADFALACARQDIGLAEAREDLSDRQNDLAALQTKLAKAQEKGAHLDLNIAKMRAVIAANLGNREETTTVLNDLLTKKSKNESDVTQIKIKIEEAQGAIVDLSKRAKEMAEDVAAFKGMNDNAASPAPAPQTATTAPERAAGASDALPPDDGTAVVIHQEVAPAPSAPAPSAPETNLNE